MSKRLFYVPMVLVISAPDAGYAEGRAEELIDALLNIDPSGLKGYTLCQGAITSRASSDWVDLEHHLERDSCGRMTIKAERP